jgi:hypothetical protein
VLLLGFTAEGRAYDFIEVWGKHTAPGINIKRPKIWKLVKSMLRGLKYN